ncbi:MAG: helix-turn-helix domain-containing protein [Candidatus Krumholzibacteria bacterium]|nr:helix-turn-helix domain-containing protein [Candidatus Krumholzibacteria bacterium]
MNENVANSVGEMLRSARESKSLTLDAVNRDTKISVDVLNSLEQDDFDSVGSDIYLKGFLKNYASFLGIDAGLVLKALDRQRGKGVLSRGTMWDIEETVAEEKLRSPRIFKRVVLPLLFVIILILTLLFINERRKVKRLTLGDARGYLQSTTVASRST